MRQAIASAARVGSVIGEVASPRCFVCRDCVARAEATSAPQGQRRYYADKPDKPKKSLVDTEKWRKKIWGTDSPPGLKDPYSGSQLAPELNRPEPAEIEAGAEEPVPEARNFEGVTLDDAKAHDPEYVPATTWEGVDKIGGAKGWWEKVWDEDNKFKAFAQSPKQKYTQLTGADYVHRAYVETKVLQEAGLDVNDVKYLPIETDIKHKFIRIVRQQTPKDEVDAVVAGEGKNARKRRKRLEAEGLSAADYKETLQFPFESWRQEIIEAINPSQEIVEDEFVEDEVEAVTAPEFDADAVTPTTAEAEAVVEDLAEPAIESSDVEEPTPKIKLDKRSVPKSWARDKDWRQVRLDDSEFKFAVIKRVMQLTGHKISDVAIQSSNRLGSLVSLAFKYERPKKLGEELLVKSKNLPKNESQWKKPANVTIHQRRHTFVDKERAVGRWKVIQPELVKRGLPLPKRASNAKY